MKDVLFPIVPLCEKQLRDVREEDRVYVGNMPLARTCRIDKAGGGYDKFRDIFLYRFGVDTGPDHFIAQLYGCTHDCPWCYVTVDGVWGDALGLKVRELVNLVHGVNDKREAAGSALAHDAVAGTARKTLPKIQVLHLMGGAPALYLNSWPALYHEIITSNLIFHSDFLLDEGLYNVHVLECLANMDKEYGPEGLYGKYGLTGIHPYPAHQLHAVSFKPGAPLSRLQLANLRALHESGLPFYVTFTGMQEEEIQARKAQVLEFGLPESVFNDSFSITLKHYKALA